MIYDVLILIYHTFLNEVQKQKGTGVNMKITRIGINYNHGPSFSINRPMGSGDYLLVLMKSTAKVTLHEQQIITEKNSLLLLNKGTPQIYAANDTTYCNDFIHFDAEGERELLHLPYDTILTLPSIKQINKILRDIYLEFISNNTNREESMDLLLRLLFVKIKEVVAYRPTDTVLYDYYDHLLNLRSMIYRHPEEKWTIARLSQQMNLSTSHFQRLYKSSFGVSCIADVITCKMEYAKASLSGTGGTVREIATLCGYENEEHFMRQFKREVGVTPSEYRRQTRT